MFLYPLYNKLLYVNKNVSNYVYNMFVNDKHLILKNHKKGIQLWSNILIPSLEIWINVKDKKSIRVKKFILRIPSLAHNT